MVQKCKKKSVFGPSAPGGQAGGGDGRMDVLFLIPNLAATRLPATQIKRMDKEDLIFKDKIPRKQELQYRLKLGTNVV